MLTEREFLIQLALGQYNQQYGRNFQAADFDIMSIDQRVNFDLSYEIFTVRLDDHLRLRVHLLLSDGDGLGPYRVESDGTDGVQTLTDEIFVALGRVDQYYKDSGVYKFNPIYPDEALLPVIHDEHWQPIQDESGEYILEETAA